MKKKVKIIQCTILEPFTGNYKDKIGEIIEVEEENNGIYFLYDEETKRHLFIDKKDVIEVD